MICFQQFDSPYSSQPLNCWATALAGVDTSINRAFKHSQWSLFKGYAFPCTHTLCADKGRSLEMALACLHDLQLHTAPLPHIQQWKSYLCQVAFELEFIRPNTRNKTWSPVGSNRKLSHTTRCNAKSRETAKEIFTIKAPAKGEICSLTWNGHMIWCPGQIDFPSIDCQLVIWDVQEHGFRLELITLDQCVLEDTWWTTDGVMTQERKRHPYVVAFHSILADWPVGSSIWDRVMLERVETLAAKFYCQTFFDYFGRAACAPHVFPLA
ncbi:hypothetical protein P691DRAFT_799070 [Macrolepiota fuliginosa MF-IS2]|uniref:Uncharacterized protein n=1 Tax=Macrolepiota fuliginosa MF-IS2 TaxID=1400762 RepID=A0A9P5X1B9_9AGAR|nr:hypothetical protein P691DRAFT_799070 [Macrolepiota fuliginosa MF-IS2]